MLHYSCLYKIIFYSTIFIWGQDGRVVKAGALGDAHVKSWDQTSSNPGFEKAHRVGLVLKLRPLVTVAGVSQNFRVHHSTQKGMAVFALEWCCQKLLDSSRSNFKFKC